MTGRRRRRIRNVLVAGATGYLGSYLVQELASRGYRVRALTRDGGRVARPSTGSVEIFEGQVTSPDSLRGLCTDIDVVISAVGITRQKGGVTYKDVDYGGNLNLLEEAVRSRVKKFLYVSVLNAEDLKQLKMVQAKLQFEERLKSSGIDHTIIRPNGFFSDMREFLKMAARGRGYVFGPGNQRSNPIHGADLACFCADAIGRDERVLEVGGPDLLSQNQILRMAFHTIDRKPEIARIPIWMTRSAVAAMRFLTPVRVYGSVEFLTAVLSRDMVAPSFGTHHLRDYFAECVGLGSPPRRAGAQAPGPYEAISA